MIDAINDAEHLEKAYSAKIHHLFTVYLQTFTDAGGDPELEGVADEQFKDGANHLRYVFDRALSLLAQGQ